MIEVNIEKKAHSISLRKVLDTTSMHAVNSRIYENKDKRE
jgi:hypothetical protein